MHVTAFSTPRHPEWRWRISDSAGEIVEESQTSFESISAAVLAGTERLLSLNIVEQVPAPVRAWGRRYGRKRQPA